MESVGHIRHIRSLRPVGLPMRDTHSAMLTDDAEVWEPLHHLFIGWHCRNVAFKEIGFSGSKFPCQLSQTLRCTLSGGEKKGVASNLAAVKLSVRTQEEVKLGQNMPCKDRRYVTVI